MQVIASCLMQRLPFSKWFQMATMISNVTAFFSTGQPCPGTWVSFDDMLRFGKMQLIYHSRVNLNLSPLLMMPGQSVFWYYLHACGALFSCLLVFSLPSEKLGHIWHHGKKRRISQFFQIVSDEWGPRQMFSFSPPSPKISYSKGREIEHSCHVR